jgi:hypothetical protein
MQMASSEHTGGRIPFKDISNTNNESGPTTSNLHLDDIDPKERKRQRARDAYANMPQDRKERLLKKRREDYHRRKTQALLTNEDSQPTIPLTAEGDTHCFILVVLYKTF